jgi:hypothetical protein
MSNYQKLKALVKKQRGAVMRIVGSEGAIAAVRMPELAAVASGELRY